MASDTTQSRLLSTSSDLLESGGSNSYSNNSGRSVDYFDSSCQLHDDIDGSDVNGAGQSSIATNSQKEQHIPFSSLTGYSPTLGPSKRPSGLSSRQVSSSATSGSTSLSTSSVVGSQKKKSKWKRNLNDLITVSRKNLPDFEERERDFYARKAALGELAKSESPKSELQVLSREQHPASLNNLPTSNSGPAKEKLSIFKKMSRSDSKGKSKVQKEETGSNPNKAASSEDYIRQNYFPTLNSEANNDHLASVNENVAETESFIFATKNSNSSASSSILNENFYGVLRKSKFGGYYVDSTEPLKFNNGRTTAPGMSTSDSIEDSQNLFNNSMELVNEDDEDANALLYNHSVTPTRSQAHREFLQKKIKPRQNVFSDPINSFSGNNDLVDGFRGTSNNQGISYMSPLYSGAKSSTGDLVGETRKINLNSVGDLDDYHFEDSSKRRGYDFDEVSNLGNTNAEVSDIGNLEGTDNIFDSLNHEDNIGRLNDDYNHATFDYAHSRRSSLSNGDVVLPNPKNSLGRINSSDDTEKRNNTNNNNDYNNATRSVSDSVTTSRNFRRRTFNPFSRVNMPRLNLLNSMRAGSSNTNNIFSRTQSNGSIYRATRSHSIPLSTNNDDGDIYNFGPSSDTRNGNMFTGDGPPNSAVSSRFADAHGPSLNNGLDQNNDSQENRGMPTINLSSLALMNRNHSLSSQELNSSAATPASPSFTNEPGSSSFLHQTQMLSRLLELATHSTLTNLIGDIDGEDGVRIDNRNRNRDLSSRVPAHRFEDGSDTNFSEFSIALQGNLLANELSNSIRLQADRERRRRLREQRHQQQRQNGELAGDSASDQDEAADDARGNQSMSFFRAFRFSSRRPRNSNGDEDEEEQVPVLIIGVRSVLPEETETVHMNGENDIRMNNIIPEATNEGHSRDSTSWTNLANARGAQRHNLSASNVLGGNQNQNLNQSASANDLTLRSSDSSVIDLRNGNVGAFNPPQEQQGPPSYSAGSALASGGHATSAPVFHSSSDNSNTLSNSAGNNSSTNGHGAGGFARSFFRNRNHRSRFRLENSRNNSRLEEIAQSYGQRVRSRNQGSGQRSWVIFLMGHLFPVDHPVLSAPTLMSDNPTYEDLLALQAMLGEVKPPVAPQEDVDSAGGLIKIVVDDSMVRNSVIEPMVIGDMELSGSLSPISNNSVLFNEDGIKNAVSNNATSDDANLETLVTVKVVSTDKCLVCLTEYDTGEVCRRLKSCGHFFHQECIDKWLTTGRNSCPLCRKKGVLVKRKKSENATNNNSTVSLDDNNNTARTFEDDENQSSEPLLEIPLEHNGNEAHRDSF